jgi:hypothetical protein
LMDGAPGGCGVVGRGCWRVPAWVSDMVQRGGWAPGRSLGVAAAISRPGLGLMLKGVASLCRTSWADRVWCPPHARAGRRPFCRRRRATRTTAARRCWTPRSSSRACWRWAVQACRSPSCRPPRSGCRTGTVHSCACRVSVRGAGLRRRARSRSGGVRGIAGCSRDRLQGGAGVHGAMFAPQQPSPRCPTIPADEDQPV